MLIGRWSIAQATIVWLKWNLDRGTQNILRRTCTEFESLRLDTSGALLSVVSTISRWFSGFGNWTDGRAFGLTNSSGIEKLILLRFSRLWPLVWLHHELFQTWKLLRFANHLHADCSERRFSVQNAKKAFVNTNPRGLWGRRAAVENRRLLSVNLTASTSRQPWCANYASSGGLSNLTISRSMEEKSMPWSC